jgi:hypothetical protein
MLNNYSNSVALDGNPEPALDIFKKGFFKKIKCPLRKFI